MPESTESSGLSHSETAKYIKDRMLSKRKRAKKMTFAECSTIFSLILCYVGSQVPSFLGDPGLNYIAAGLDIGSQRSWITTSSSLATACIVPISGYIQDMVGRKASLFGSLGMVLVGLILSATAQSFGQVLAGSVLSGVGTGIEELTALAAIAELVPVKQRGFIFGFTTFATVIFGPALLYASEMSIHATWRWIYWASVVWNGCAAFLAAITYGRMSLNCNKPSNPLGGVMKLDFVGMILLVAGGTELLIALQSGGVTKPWRSAYVSVQLCIGISLLGVLAAWESFAPGRPLIPVRLFRGQRVVALSFAISVLTGFFYTTILSLGPTILNEVFQLSTVRTGFVSMGAAFGLTMGATMINMLITALDGRTRELLLFSAIIMTGFTGAQASISPTDHLVWAILGSFAALGVGGTLVPLSTIVTIACPQDLIGTAIGLVIALRTIGGSVGYAIYYNIYTSSTRAHLPRLIADSAMQNGLSRNQATSLAIVFVNSNNPLDPSLGTSITANTTVLEAAHLAYEIGGANAARLVYYGSIPVGAVVLICVLCLPNMKDLLTEKVLTWHIDTKTLDVEQA